MGSRRCQQESILLLAPVSARSGGTRARAPRNTLRDCARARRPPGGIYGGQGGACNSKRGATFYPLWHSAIFPDPTFLKIPDFLKKRFRLKIISKIDLAGSRRSFSDFSAFLKNAGQYSPQRSLRQRGAPHLEPLLYSARFACPGMLIFAHFEYSGTPGKALSTQLKAFRKDCPGCPLLTLSGTLAYFRIPHFLKSPDF